MSGIFQFKQFSVDQTGCAMKINTDGVLLGALAEANDPETVLDIGTGTGVIALMLAQRFASVQIDAIEIDKAAAQTAGINFSNSPFADRVNIFSTDFQDFFKDHQEKKYDLIVSNPPFHLNSLKSPEIKKSLAKHTGESFFKNLISGSTIHLTTDGLLWLILPVQAAGLVKELAGQFGLCLHKDVTIHSFENDLPHREILVLGRADKKLAKDKFVIYHKPNEYSVNYKSALRDFFTIFN